MKTLLLPTDFSENALKAVHYAASIAQQNNYALHLLHTYVILYAGYDGEQRTERLLEQQAKIANEQMKPLLESLQKQFPDLLISGNCEGGFAVDSIIQTLKNGNFSMVVMGTKGVSNAVEKLLGSTTNEVINLSPIPVLAVPQSVEPIQQKIKIGFFTAINDYEINTLLRTFHILGSNVETHLFHLYPTGSSKSKELESWELRLNAEFPERNLIFHTAEVNQIDASAVAKLSNTEKLDLLVFTRPHKSFFSKIFSKSLTKDVAEHIYVPALFIRG